MDDVLYSGGLLSVQGVMYLGFSFGSLCAVIPRRQYFDRRASVLLVVFYGFGLVVVVDEAAGALAMNRGASWLTFALAMLVAVLAHAVMFERHSRQTRIVVAPLDAAAIGAADAATNEQYEQAVVLVDSSATVEELTRRSTRDVVDATGRHLLGGVHENQLGVLQLYGWSQFLDDRSPPSAIGTAYGIRAVLSLDLRRSGAVDISRLVSSVMSLQQSGGGWSARSQRGDVGHPEVTAWVLPALTRAGLAGDARSAAIDTFVGSVNPETDDGFSYTTVVTVCLSSLIELAPASERVGVLEQLLVNAAQRLESGCSGWGPRTNGSSEVTACHTARAVVALRSLIDRGVSAHPDTESVIARSTKWLRENEDTDLFDEVIRRQTIIGTETDQITVGNFTPAWVARALMASEDAANLQRIRDSVRLVLARQTNGVWRWNRTRSQPVWMAYQGMLVLREYAQRNLPWPP